MTNTIEYDAECNRCKGTGVYVGMGERDGIGVRCYGCKGTGHVHHRIEFEPFTGRKRREDVSWVIERNPGIVVGIDESLPPGEFGGMTYEAWWGGHSFVDGMEMRKYVCPAWWYQSADSKRKPDWKKCDWGAFYKCQHFSEKDQCWAEWDKEFGK